MSGIVARLADRRLVVVTGKGGVGKSAITAALGLMLVRAGRRALLLEVDPRESLYAMLGVEPSGGEIVPVLPGLHVQNLRPRAVIDRVVRERIPLGFVADRVLKSPIYGQFADGAPGLKEMAVLAHARRIVAGASGSDAPEVDVVLLDAPATGHGLSMLTAPRLVADAIPDGPVGKLASQIAGFVADESACGVVVVTLPEEMPVQETLELVESLGSRLSRRPDAVIANGLYPEPDAATDRTPRGAPAVELWLRRRAGQERELARLANGCPGPRIELPLLALERGPELAAALGESLVRNA